MSLESNEKGKLKRSSCILPQINESESDAKKRRVASESDAAAFVDEMNNGHPTTFKDYICPICLELLIEPVVLPCKHELCLACFNPYLENASLLCPICRARISIWARKNRKAKTLVDQELWNLIKTQFPDRVNRRLGILKDGVESTQDDEIPARIIATDGELRREYEEELKKVELEDAAIARADMDLIKSILHEEEARKKIEEDDLIAAMNLQKEEMSKDGKPLKLPAEHKYQLSKLFKKSPMKLRNRNSSVELNSSSKLKGKLRLGEFSGRSCS